MLLGEGERPDALDAPRVAIVGTRSATPHGLADARELGGFLADAGVTVVSGLAIGIDGAAHEGALDAGGLAVGVVATGLDVTYPRRHRALYDRVREHGLVVGEHGYGVQPSRERFPVRNRIIAALAEIVVVVEATATGGARITAGYAAEYGRDVFALPGSRRNPAAAGCNALIADGAEPLLDPGDLLIALGPGREPARALELRRSGRTVRPGRGRRAARARRRPGHDRRPRAEHRALGPARLGAALNRLERAGRVQRRRGLWWPTLTRLAPTHRKFLQLRRELPTFEIVELTQCPYDSTPIEAEVALRRLDAAHVLRAARRRGNGTAPGCAGCGSPTARPSSPPAKSPAAPRPTQ